MDQENQNTETPSTTETGAEISAPESAGQVKRRNFMTQVLAGVIGAVVGIVPFIYGLLFFLDPLIRKRAGAGESRPGGPVKDKNGFIKMGITADALPADGSPQMFKIRDDINDAWNRYLDVEIGTVWLRRTKEGEVMAFSSICPHLGCAVDYRKSNQDFYCPCHTSAFDLDGKKKNVIPPRNMDSLTLKPDTGNEIWVKYETFRATLPEKKPIT
jgi:menaquinol-cytochrome c reductase iron-sulfur subunit